MTGESILTLDRVLALAKQVVDGKSISYVGAAKQMAEWLLTNEAKLHGVHGRIVVPDGVALRRVVVPDGVALRFTPHPFPKIVCLCGSTSFGDAFAKANLDETLKGNIVLTVGCMTHSDDELGDTINVRRCRRCHLREDDQRGAVFAAGRPACGVDVMWPDNIARREPEHDFVDTKVLLDELHKRKIDLCDEVLVLNVKRCTNCGEAEASWGKNCGCSEAFFQPYIGDSTRSEIAYAEKLGRPTRYLNEVKCPARLTLIAWDNESQCTGGGPEHDAPNERLAAARERITKHLAPDAPDAPGVKRVPVTYLWSKLNWDFLKLLAEIAHYAEEKYGSAEQYMNARLTGQADPINHVYEHLRQYQVGEPHDKFGDTKYHLAAAAYNIMMAAAAEARWGFVPNPVMAKTRKKDP